MWSRCVLGVTRRTVTATNASSMILDGVVDGSWRCHGVRGVSHTTSCQPPSFTPVSLRTHIDHIPTIIWSPLLTDDEWTDAEWTECMSDARKLLQLPPLSLNAQLLGSEQLQLVAQRLQAAAGEHSDVISRQLRRTAELSRLEARAVITLLVARTALTYHSSDNDNQTQPGGGVGGGVGGSVGGGVGGGPQWQRLVLLAAATELMHTACLMHRSVSEFSRGGGAGVEEVWSLARRPSTIDRLLIMAGDLVFSGAFRQLALLRHSAVFGRLAGCVADMSEAAVQSAVTVGAGQWARRHLKLSGTQLANSCRAAVLLATEHLEAGPPAHLLSAGHQLGKHVALAWQARADIEHVRTCGDAPLRVSALPVSLHVASSQQLAGWLLPVLGERPLSCAESQQLRQLVVDGGGVQQAEHVLDGHIAAANQLLRQWPDTAASRMLGRIISLIAAA